MMKFKEKDKYKIINSVGTWFKLAYWGIEK